MPRKHLCISDEDKSSQIYTPAVKCNKLPYRL